MMTKGTIIAIAAITSGALAVAGAMLWTTEEPKLPTPTIQVTVEPIENLRQEEDDDSYELSMAEDVTQIIIRDDRNDDDVEGEIQGILSKKIIVNDEVRDVRDATRHR